MRLPTDDQQKQKKNKKESHSAPMTYPVDGQRGYRHAFFAIPMPMSLAFIIKVTETPDCVFDPFTVTEAEDSFARARVQCHSCHRTIFVIYLSNHDNSCEIRANGICQCRTGEDLWAEPKLLDYEGKRFFSIDLREACEKLRPKGFVDNAHFRKTARFILKKRTLPGDQPDREFLTPRAYTKAALLWQRKLKRHLKHLDDYIDNVLAKTGYVKVIKAPLPRDKDGKVLSPKKKYAYKGHNISCLIWIPKWAITAYEQAEYIQLDCSFRATKPFAYCVPQAMIHNAAVPLGFIMTPRECALTYTMFMEEVWGFKEGQVTDKPVLSDQGPALSSFCDDHGIPQFFCHRHLIELFGAASAAGMLASRVLRIQTKETFEALRDQFIADAEAMHRNGFMKQKALDRFKTWLADFTDGLWEREHLGIARCSNHAERFHGIVNQRIAGVRALVGRLDILRQTIEDRHAEYSNGWDSQVQYAIEGLKRMKLEQRDECDDPECIAYRHMMTTRLGCDDFPCAHLLNVITPQKPAFPDLENTANEQLVLSRQMDQLFLQDLRLSAAQRKSLMPKDSGPPPPKAVIEWDDEVEIEDRTQAPNPDNDYRVAEDIVTGVFQMRRRARDLPRLDKINAAMVIHDHLMRALRLETRRYEDVPGHRGEERKFEGADKRRWLADYGVSWWHLARTGEKCPAADPPSLASGPDLIPDVGPQVRFLDPDD
jgi:hypothetical protein